jgi:NAD-dependent dihydropyrimidine dehydrogenase PreA subunit
MLWLLLLIPAAALALWLAGERGRLLRPSTRRLFRASGSWRNALHGYVYARWTNQYVDALLNRIPGGNGGGRWLADHYHGKILTHEHAEALVSLDKDLPRRDLEQIVPYPVARDIVLTGPPDVAAYECACRHARPTHCHPTQVCMVVGQPFVDFVLEHNPTTSRRLTQQEALDLLRAERDRGHLHSAWFKDAFDGRFYAICNCCKCCCGSIDAMTKRGIPMLAASGFVAEIDAELCAQCGTCVGGCPFDALHADQGPIARDWDKCMGCGVCETLCPNGAIHLARDERKGTPLDVRALA